MKSRPQSTAYDKGWDKIFKTPKRTGTDRRKKYTEKPNMKMRNATNQRKA